MARKIQPRSNVPKPKKGQSSEDYWRERETRQRAANIHDEARYAARINDIFQSTQDSVQQEIESFYQRYASKEGIDIAEARHRVSKIDMEKYERLAAQYVKAAHEGGREAAFSDEANEQMRLYNATMRINRLEMLKARCGIRAMEGYRLADQLINEGLEERAYSEYYRLAGILGNTAQFNENMVRSIVDASYQNATWSQRLWNNQALRSERIGAQIAQGILTGKGSDVLARNIQKLTGQSTYVCQRLMRTELRRVQTAAAEQSMKDNGVTEYKFMVANGVNPCDECLNMDGQVFKLSEMAVGKNAPPIHPSCHCCTAPYVDEAKWQRWLESGMEVPWEEFEKDGVSNLEPYFRNGNPFMNDRPRSAAQLQRRAEAIRQEMKEYAANESKWSGRFRVVSRMERTDINGVKHWNCDISATSFATDGTIWHEMLHSVSSSYYGPDIYLKNQIIEETSVEFFKQQICIEKKIEDGKGYPVHVKILTVVADYVRTSSRMDFAKELFNIPLPDRYDWLEKRVYQKLQEDNRTTQEINQMINFTRQLSGAFEDD